jgi:tRNA(Arg) A34 adenosine deaminase TadA
MCPAEGCALMAAEQHMRQAIALSLEMMRTNRGGPFGAIVVKDDTIVAEGFNQITSTNDRTAHAEVVAIRRACQALGTFDLSGCEIYSSCEPCPMCLASIYLARLSRIYYANDRVDAAKVGFRDDFLYNEIVLPLDRRAIPTEPLLCPKDGKRSRHGWISPIRSNTDGQFGCDPMINCVAINTPSRSNFTSTDVPAFVSLNSARRELGPDVLLPFSVNSTSPTAKPA